MSDYKRISLYFREDKMNDEDIAAYTLLKSVGRHQTELVVQIVASFLGKDNLKDFTELSEDEVMKILKERAITIRRERESSIKKLFNAFDIDDELNEAQPLRTEKENVKQEEPVMKEKPLKKEPVPKIEEDKTEEKDVVELPDEIEDIEIPEDDPEPIAEETELSDDYEMSEEDIENARIASSFFDDGQ